MGNILVLRDSSEIQISEYAMDLAMFKSEVSANEASEIFEKLTTKNLSLVKVYNEYETEDEKTKEKSTVRDLLATFRTKQATQFTYDGSVATFTLVGSSDEAVAISDLQETVDGIMELLSTLA